MGKRMRRKFMVPVSETRMLSAIFFFLCSILYCSARDTITPEDWLSNDSGTLVSAGEAFELGFFNPDGSSEIGRFVGIWYYKSKPRRVVWVANRDNPLPLSDTPSGVFSIKEDGVLKLLDEKGTIHWSSGSETSSSSTGRVVKLMDSGNLVLSDNRSGEILWESFHNPTDTFLPGMKMVGNLTLTSWLSPGDPAPGNYSFKLDIDNENQYDILENSIPVWSSEDSDGTPDEMPVVILRLLSNFSKTREPTSSRNLISISPSKKNWTNSTNTNSWLLVMDSSGQIQYYNPEKKSLVWWAPRDRCSVLNACGEFGTCNNNNALMCKCLPGFKPASPNLWESGKFSSGCTRKSAICENSSEDTFLSLKMMKVRKRDSLIPADLNDSQYCRKACINRCKCQAFAEHNIRQGRLGTAPECLIWTDDLTGLQEEYPSDAYNLFVRVAISDIKPTVRNCEPCGSNMIPYPLSNGSRCGDPMYSNFECNNTTGQVLFKVPGGAYRVTSINPELSTFVIQQKEADCSSRDKIPPLNPPFHMGGCKQNGAGNFGFKMSLKDSIEIEISWDPPWEPVCASPADCKDWPNSTCRTANGTTRCFCNENFKWNGSTLVCVQGGGNLAEPPKDVDRNSSSSSLVVVVSVTIAVVLVALFGIIGYIAYLCKGTIAKRKENRVNQGRHLYQSESRVKHLIDSEQFKEEDKKGIDVPFFDLEDILAATDNFSDANKLGRGGFGPVYKVTVLNFLGLWRK